MPSKKLTAQKRAELERKKYKQQRSSGFPTLLILFIVIIVGVVGVYFVVSNLGNGDTNGGTPIVNTAPSAIDDYAVLAMNSEIYTIDPLANDIDLDNDNLTITRITYPTHGYAEMVSGLIQYTPETNFSGVDSFDYIISDGENEATSKVHVIVTANTNPIALIDTTMGTIVVELYEDKVNNTVENFVKLANDGFYQDLVFHRVIDDFMIQGGSFTASGIQTPSPYGAIDLEIHPDVLHVDGAIAMARTADPNSATSQFYICDGAQRALDDDYRQENYGESGYTAFGVTIYGIEVVRSIASVDTTTKNGMADWPEDNVFINSITIENG